MLDPAVLMRRAIRYVCDEHKVDPVAIQQLLSLIHI